MNKKNQSKSVGGIARRDALSPDVRSEIAKKAAMARWNKSTDLPTTDVRKALWGAPEKMLKIGNTLVECYVLEGGVRVLSGRGMQEAIGLGGTANTHGTKLRSFLGSDSLKGFVNNELTMAIETPTRFTRPGRGGVPAIAFEATLLIDLCEAIIRSYNSGELRKNYFHLVFQAQAITLSFAKAGIISAIDEVTGYQEVREKDEIQKIVDKYLIDYAKKWAKVFPDQFWEKLLRVKGYESYIGLPRPSFVGHWVNDIIYSRLAPGIRTKLKELNPRTEKGNRKYKNHQFLTDDQGAPELRELLTKAMALMDASTTSEEFDRLLARALPKFGDTIEMPF